MVTLMNLPIVDLHCDLLSYLSGNLVRTAYDPESRCSIPFLKDGGVVVQTLAIYTRTQSKSVKDANTQFNIFKKLPKQFPNEIVHFSDLDKHTSCPQIILSIENASGILNEKEPFEKGIERLNQFQKEAGPILYIGLTWHDENRFAGGNLSPDIPLKEDGKRLLEFMAENHISIDLSHTSDPTAEGILNYIETKNLPLIPIASHSNFRTICDAPRNLPDEFVKEIIRKEGVIGLNFVKAFVGKPPDFFWHHLEHIDSLGGWNHMCLGADFFTDIDTPKEFEHLMPFFFDEYANSSCYPHFLDKMREKFSEEKLQQLCFQNFFSYLDRRDHLK